MSGTDIPDMYARLLAVQVGLMAVIATAPKNPAMLAALEREIERAMSILLARPMPDSSIAAFQSQIESIRLAMKQQHS